MKTERCWYLTTASMLSFREGDIMRWYPGCKATVNGMISGYQNHPPRMHDPDFGVKNRKWLFQCDIKSYFLKLVQASRIPGK